MAHHEPLGSAVAFNAPCCTSAHMSAHLHTSIHIHTYHYASVHMQTHGETPRQTTEVLAPPRAKALRRTCPDKTPVCRATSHDAVPFFLRFYQDAERSCYKVDTDGSPGSVADLGRVSVSSSGGAAASSTAGPGAAEEDDSCIVSF